MEKQDVDVLLVGGGIMSATLGTLLNKLNPDLNILMVEQATDVALESSEVLNNAGTGHAGYCELNYTPEVNGNIEIGRALKINANFESSLQLWASLVECGNLPAPEQFINRTPHLSFVMGEDNVAFLQKRQQLLQAHHLFKEMLFSQEAKQLEAWMPLMMKSREQKSNTAATYINHGADVDFGSLTRHLVNHLAQQPNFSLATSTQIKGLTKEKQWLAELHHTQNENITQVSAPFVFIGAGGGTLPILQKSGVKQVQGYGGFPVSGQWLICNNKAVIEQHHAKVYGQAAVGAPPMSVPHLDTRMINGKQALLFGPFAGFTTKFLKHGSPMALPQSIQRDNIKPMLSVAKNNTKLIQYLVSEATKTHNQRMQSLLDFVPNAKESEWELAQAGQRVQIIKQGDQHWGTLAFGTETITTDDGSLAALLGASPGASVSAQAMIDIIDTCQSKALKPLLPNGWQKTLKTLVPAYGESLIDNKNLLISVRQYSHKKLNLFN